MQTQLAVGLPCDVLYKLTMSAALWERLLILQEQSRSALSQTTVLHPWNSLKRLFGKPRGVGSPEGGEGGGGGGGGGMCECSEPNKHFPRAFQVDPCTSRTPGETAVSLLTFP